MASLSIFFTADGILIADGSTLASSLADRFGAAILTGEMTHIVINQTNNAAPVVSGALDIVQLETLAHNLSAANWNAISRDTFATIVGTLAGIAALPYGPAAALAVEESFSAAFAEAYNDASAWSSNQTWGVDFQTWVNDTKNDFNSYGAPLVNALIENVIDTLSGDLIVRQYSIGGSEFLTMELVDGEGFSYGEIGRVSGDAADEYEFVLPTTFVTVDSLSNPTSFSWPASETIDLSALTPINMTTYPLNSTNFSNAFSAITNPSNYDGNTLDFAHAITGSAGVTGGYLDSGSLLDIYDYTMNFFLDNDYFALMDPYSLSLDAPAYVDSYYNSISSTSYGITEYCTPEFTLVHDSLSSIFGETNQNMGWISLDEYIDYIDAEYADHGSPIAIDLNGDGLQTTSLRKSLVTFDITGDGVAERTGWLSAEDGFLAYDQNGNGEIDGVSELFGGLERGEGYAKLSAFDENGDRVITSADSKFSQFSIWQDINQNGITDSGELQGLSGVGLTSLSVDYTSQDVFDEGNLIGEHSEAVLNGNNVAMGDIYFRYYTSTRPFDSNNTQTDQQLGLLIDAMATFPPEAPGEISVTSNYQNNQTPLAVSASL